MREYEILPENGKERRHFKDHVLDVIIWKNKVGELDGFQINYLGETFGPDSVRYEDRVITFFQDKGLKYAFVPEENRDLPTPKILEPKDYTNQNNEIANYIRQNSGEIPWAIVQFIVKELTKSVSVAS
jgi:hypothetical protein